jgi:hypothetical protein
MKSRSVHEERFVNAAADVAAVLLAGLSVDGGSRNLRRLVQTMGAAVRDVALSDDAEIKRLMAAARELVSWQGVTTSTCERGRAFVDAAKRAA